MNPGELKVGVPQDATIPAKLMPVQPIVIHQLTGDQVSTLRGANFTKTVLSTLTGAALSNAVTLLVTLRTVNIEDANTLATFRLFHVASWVGFALAALFWGRAEWSGSQVAKQVTPKE